MITTAREPRSKPIQRFDRLSAPEGYGRQLKARLINAFDQNQVRFVLGQNHFERAHADHFMPHLPSFPFPDNPVKAGAFNTRYSQVVEGMIPDKNRLSDLYVENSNNSKEAQESISGIGGLDYMNLPHIAAEVAKGETPRPVVVRVIMGATTQMPLRSLSYMVPALTYGEQLKKAGIPVQIQFISAHNLTSQLNAHIDATQAQKEAEMFSRVGREFANEFFAGVANHATFLQDTGIQHGAVLRSELLSIAKTLGEHAPAEVKEMLRSKSEKRSDARMGIFYGAAHLLLHDADIKGAVVPINSQEPAAEDPSALISVGGKEERRFYSVRFGIKGVVGGHYHDLPTLQLITKHSVPPYYFDREGDIGLEESVKSGIDFSQPIGKSAEYDLKYLFGVADKYQGKGAFSRFIAEASL